MKRILFFLFAIAACAGCGQKGPLYLPGDPSEILSAPASEPTGAAEDEEDNEDRAEPVP